MAMNLEGVAKAPVYLSAKLNSMLKGMEYATTYFFEDASLQDRLYNRCSYSTRGLNQKELVAKVKSCGHVYSIDNYFRQCAVRSQSNHSRHSASARCVRSRSTTLRVHQ